MISLIMPAKNTERFIGEAIEPLLKVNNHDWELIIVEDHSEDRTFDIASDFARRDNRIKVYKNIGHGKVMGLNYGYSKTHGNIIKCIDSDDVIDIKFFDLIANLKEFDAHCHDSIIVDDRLNILGKYNANTAILTNEYSAVLQKLISLPRWSWSFSREIAEKIFPMPEELPFEDVWFSLIIKKM